MFGDIYKANLPNTLLVSSMSANDDAGAATIATNVLLVRSKLSDSVLLRPRFLDGSYRDHIMAQLRSSVEGVCTRHGYVLAGSVQLLNIMAARVDPASMNGDTIFNVRYSALVCNPPVGLIVPVRVYDSNMFAVFAQAGVLSTDGEFTPLVDVILVKAQHEGGRLEMLSALPSGAEAKAVIVGKRFEIGDPRISAVAQLLTEAEAESGDVETAMNMSGSPASAGAMKLPSFTRSLAAVLPVEALARNRNAQTPTGPQQGGPPESIAGDEDGRGLVDDEDNGDEEVTDEGGDSDEDNDEEEDDENRRIKGDEEDDDDDDGEDEEEEEEDDVLPEDDDDDASGSESG